MCMHSVVSVVIIGGSPGLFDGLKDGGENVNTAHVCTQTAAVMAVSLP